MGIVWEGVTDTVIVVVSPTTKLVGTKVKEVMAPTVAFKLIPEDYDSITEPAEL